jgi:hypothetical protein
MTKAELLADLSSKMWVYQLVGDPSDITPANEQPENLKWYKQTFLEQQKRALIKRTLVFYVLDDSLETEAAFYQEREPEPTLTVRQFEETLKYTLAINPAIFGFKLLFVSEEVDKALVKLLEEDAEGKLIPAAYLYYNTADGIQRKQINLSTELVAQITSL